MKKTLLGKVQREILLELCDANGSTSSVTLDFDKRTKQE